MMKRRKAKMTMLGLIRRLLPFVMKDQPLWFTLTLIVGVFHSLSHGFMTVIFQLFIDAVSGAVMNETVIAVVVWVAAGLVATAIGMEVLNGLHNFMANQFWKKMSGSLGKRIHAKASRIEPVCYEDPSLLNDINKANAGMVNSMDLLFTFATIFMFYVPYFVFLGVYLYILQPILALSLVFIFIPVLIAQFIRGTIFAKLEDQSAPVRREYEYYEKCIGDREYYKETRLLGSFRFFRELYETALILLGKRIWQAQSRIGLIELGMKLLTLTGYMAVLYMLFRSLMSGAIGIGAFAAVFASIDKMFSVMEEMIARHIARLNTNLATVKNFIRYLDLPEREGEDLPVHVGDGIQLSNVTFRYPGADRDSLVDVSLEVKKGETIAIVGENGAGKTTLVKMMVGLYTPNAGTVRIGGADTKQVSSSSIYRGISAVFQKYQRYKMTLADNIRISDRLVDEELRSARMNIAVSKADLQVDSEQYPVGFDTMLSREFDGIDLSGGQWQRLAIARGFFRAHDLIVLDEPTAAIDPLEETRIYKKFAEISQDKTAVIVTHRLGSAKIADRIVVMDGGKVCETGTHESLLRAGGKYAEMFQAQAQWYDDERMKGEASPVAGS